MRIFIKIFLILLVFIICVIEACAPLPDFTRKEYEAYYPQTLSLKSNIPCSILILYRIEDKESLRLFKKRHGIKRERLPLTQWVQKLELTDEEVDKILKYESYIEKSTLSHRSATVRH